MLDNGWEFRTDFPGATGDRLHGRFMREVYTRAEARTCRAG
jgi:glutathionyl-hydroquinone reductase